MAGTVHMEIMEKQAERVKQIWLILGGNFYGHITLNNLRMMCLAIKGLHVSPDVEFSESSTHQFQINSVDPNYPENLPVFGLFSAEGDLHLSQTDVEKATTHFKILIQNRLLHEQDLLTQKKEARDKIQPFSFKPVVNEKSARLAEKSRSRQ